MSEACGLRPKSHPAPSAPPVSGCRNASSAPTIFASRLPPAAADSGTTSALTVMRTYFGPTMTSRLSVARLPSRYERTVSSSSRSGCGLGAGPGGGRVGHDDETDDPLLRLVQVNADREVLQREALDARHLGRCHQREVFVVLRREAAVAVGYRARAAPDERVATLGVRTALGGLRVDDAADVRDGRLQLRDRPRGAVARAPAARLVEPQPQVARAARRYHPVESVAETHLAGRVVQDVVAA